MRATYWTGVWEPTKEAISKEVAWLRAGLSAGSPVVAFSGQASNIDLRNRVLQINVRRWAGLRAAAMLIEPFGDITHLFGGIGTTEHFLHVLGRRPIVFTVVIAGSASSLDLYGLVRCFVAQTPGLANALAAAGVPKRLIHTIYPAIDVNAFRPNAPPAAGPFTLLFASTPSALEELDARGIGLLIQLAKQRPDINIRVLWRRWGDVAAGLEAVKSRSPTPNFIVSVGDVADIRREYQAAHATVCCFEEGAGKAAPNSVVEGMACGRPTLMSDTCELADTVAHYSAGAVTSRTVEGLSQGIDALMRSYAARCSNARHLAVAEFDSATALRRYAAIYEAVAAGGAVHSRPRS